ncbi:hypothetical protein F4677DRAFT_464051 [Hypoxylon crocopeplum]|nr:hypothetical protein F4677DRAFT_464051 [Hypoxylon crocopeplum]
MDASLLTSADRPATPFSMTKSINILSSQPSMAIDVISSYVDLLYEASSLEKHENSRRVSVRSANPNTNQGVIRIWVCRIPDRADVSLEAAAERCRAFCEPCNSSGPSSLVIPFYRSHGGSQRLDHDSESFLLAASRPQPPASNSADEDALELSRHTTSGIFASINQFWKRYTGGQASEYHYEAVSAEKATNGSRFLNGTVVRNLFAALLIIIIGVLVFSGGTSPSSSDGNDDYYDESEWRRYDVGSSIGPKEQLRIQWHNASEWGRSNPHQNGEWAFRIDDQSIIPADLLDDDEKDRQTYFRKRYPHMAAVVDVRDYIRPAWLGSKSILIDWDPTFHDAHCVLALRRYFKAKETGRHVCPRDIDPGHILHCLNMLEKTIFKPGPMTRQNPQGHMHWETKYPFASPKTSLISGKCTPKPHHLFFKMPNINDIVRGITTWGLARTGETSTPTETGVSVIHESTGQIADVVFACDINGDFECPCTLLEDELGSGRILIFRYTCSLENFSDIVSGQTVEDYTTKLLDGISQKRDIDHMNRPIIFAAHGFGGLVCEDILSKSVNREERHQNILNQIYSILFLDTPHYRAGLAEWATILAKKNGLTKQTISQKLPQLRMA